VDLAPLKFFCTFTLISLVIALGVDLGYAAAGSGAWVASLVGMIASLLCLAGLSFRSFGRRRSRRMRMTELDRALTVRPSIKRIRSAGGRHAR
jgi:hypothetical protein